MLSIIIGIVIIAVLIFVGIEIKINDTIFSVIFVGVILSSLVIGLFYPAKGFTDWQLVKETELVTLSNSVASQGSGRMFYVSISADNVYSYRYEIESEFKTEGSKSYKVDTVSGDNVEEIEEANSSKAILQEYHRKGKMSIWSFAFTTRTSAPCWRMSWMVKSCLEPGMTFLPSALHSTKRTRPWPIRIWSGTPLFPRA